MVEFKGAKYGLPAAAILYDREAEHRRMLAFTARLVKIFEKCGQPAPQTFSDTMATGMEKVADCMEYLDKKIEKPAENY